MSVLDASVMIALLDEDDPHHETAVGIVTRQIQEDEALVCSVITMAEALVGPAKHERLAWAQRAFYDELGIITLTLPPDAALSLAQWRAHTGLKLPDCCVLLAKRDHHSGSLLTFDERLGKAAVEFGMRVVMS